MSTRRRILVTLESRATFGYSINVLKVMAADPALEVQTIVTGMHLMPELGNTVETLTAAGIPISASVPLTPSEGRGGWTRAMGTAMAGFADAYEKLAPDIILISGDRAETFALCVAAAYMGIPIAHIQAGDKSGHIDDAARMAIAKLAHIHFAPGPDAAKRLRRLGEQEFRIFDVGAPQLDDMVDRDWRRASIRVNGRPFDLTRPYLMIVQHPVMVERDQAQAQMEVSLRACLSTGLPIVWVYPNSDLGFRDILLVIEREREHGQVVAVPNLPREEYLVLLANAACLVGNSSSGLLEAPTFKVPVVNVGDRQRGRPQASNILNCPVEESAIAKTLSTALNDPGFKTDCARAINPFGDGRSGKRIAAILRDIHIDEKLLDKQTVY